MILHLESGRWYIDVRGPGTSDEHSADLVQHIPRRLCVGPIIVVAENPKVALSVLRKRWMRLLRDVEIQRSSTMDRLQRTSLQHEVTQMTHCKFSAQPFHKAPSGTQVFFVRPEDLSTGLPEHTTLYIMTPMTTAVVRQALTKLRPGGLIAIYGEWTVEYELILQQAFA
jgi:hypothetical protein